MSCVPTCSIYHCLIHRLFSGDDEWISSLNIDFGFHVSLGAVEAAAVAGAGDARRRTSSQSVSAGFRAASSPSTILMTSLLPNTSTGCTLFSLPLAPLPHLTASANPRHFPEEWQKRRCDYVNFLYPCVFASLHLCIPPRTIPPLCPSPVSTTLSTPRRPSATPARGLSLLVLPVRHHAKLDPDRDPALLAICTNERDSSGRDVAWSCSITEQPCLCACVNRGKRSG